MKANEAPKKIYLFENPTSNTPDDRWLSKRSDENDIEYIRIDTFIEKAVEWLKENKDHPFIGCEDPCLSGYLTDGFIEAFKKAMEE